MSPSPRILIADEAPSDGQLPEGVKSSELSIYLHVPFCARRCGYCDFNTYTAEELHRDGVVVRQQDYIDQALAELDLARSVLGEGEIRVKTIFVGGGTPTLLPAEHLNRFVARVKERFLLDSDAEITTEANPDSVSRESLQSLREGGFTRLSLGMQSAVPHVLSALDRTHDPERVALAAQWAQDAGFAHISADLIYGAPGESLSDWQNSLESAIALPVDHISAYALIVEDGTRLAAQVARGEVVIPDDDETAEKYLLADEMLTRAGMEWYELSNWARPDGHSLHNIAYWQSADWWGIGPGAHSHVGGVRWWNVRHPSAYAQRLTQSLSPADSRETVNETARRWETIMLGVRLREGLDVDLLSDTARAALPSLIQEGLIDPVSVESNRIVLTLPGRLLADAIVRRLVD
jgi:putative oxygen-independent coproporphyrinogen III oxidase